MHDVINQLNNTRIDRFVLIFLSWPLIAAAAYFLLPFFRGKKASLLILLVTYVSLSIIFPLVFLLGWDAKKNGWLDALHLPFIMLMFQILFVYLLRKRWLSSWLNDDKKYQALTIPRDGKEIHLTYPHPLRLRIGAVWVAGYWVLFPIGVAVMLIVTVAGDAVWALDLKAIGIKVLAAAGFMAITHLALAFVEKCPFCHFSIFRMDPDNKQAPVIVMKLAFRILFKRSFNCINCGAHFTVGKSLKSQLPEVK